MDNREDVGQYYPGGTVVPAKPEPASHPIESVNGKAGAVVLTAEDVGALPATTEIPDAEKVSEWGFLKKAWSDLVAAFAAKVHRHTIGYVDGLQSELSTLDQKATEASDLSAAAQTAANAASDKADAANAALAGKLDKTAVVAPSASATAGQAADAAKVGEALAMKAPSNITTASDDKIRIVYGDNVWWIVPLGIYYWNDGEAGEHAHSPTAVFSLPTSAHDSSFALTSDIEDAVKDKADITAIRTALASLDASNSSIADIINALKGI